MHVRVIALLAGGLTLLGALVYLSLQLGQTPSHYIQQGQSNTAPAREPATAAAQAPRSSRPETNDSDRDGDGEIDSEYLYTLGARKGTPVDPVEIARAMIPPVDPPPPPPPPVDPSTLSPNNPAIKKKAPRTLEQRKQYVNRLYTARDYYGALNQARLILEETPGDIPMLQMLISSACALGEAKIATTYYEKLPEGERDLVIERCAEHGIQL